MQYCNCYTQLQALHINKRDFDNHNVGLYFLNLLFNQQKEKVMDTKAFKVSWILLVIVTSIVTILGLTLTFASTFFLTSEFEMYTGQKLADFAESNPHAYSFLLLQYSEMGIWLFTIGILTLLITIVPYRRGDKWAWYLYLIGLTLASGGTIGFNIPTGDMSVILIPAILLVIGYVGLAIGAKSVLKKSAT